MNMRYHTLSREKLKFLLQKNSSPWGRSKFCKGSIIGKDDKDELKSLNWLLVIR